jgi:hypothetical protein
MADPISANTLVHIATEKLIRGDGFGLSQSEFNQLASRFGSSATDSPAEYRNAIQILKRYGYDDLAAALESSVDGGVGGKVGGWVKYTQEGGHVENGNTDPKREMLASFLNKLSNNDEWKMSATELRAFDLALAKLPMDMQLEVIGRLTRRAAAQPSNEVSRAMLGAIHKLVTPSDPPAETPTNADNRVQAWTSMSPTQLEAFATKHFPSWTKEAGAAKVAEELKQVAMAATATTGEEVLALVGSAYLTGSGFDRQDFNQIYMALNCNPDLSAADRRDAMDLIKAIYPKLGHALAPRLSRDDGWKLIESTGLAEDGKRQLTAEFFAKSLLYPFNDETGPGLDGRISERELKDLTSTLQKIQGRPKQSELFDKIYARLVAL